MNVPTRNGSFFHCDTIDNLQLTCRDHLISFKSYHDVLRNDSLSDAINNTSKAVQLSPQAVHVVLRISKDNEIAHWTSAMSFPQMILKRFQFFSAKLKIIPLIFISWWISRIRCWTTRRNSVVWVTSWQRKWNRSQKTFVWVLAHSSIRMFRPSSNQHQIRTNCYLSWSTFEFFFSSSVERPCPTSYTGPCVKAYGFKHHMSLSENVTEFEVGLFLSERRTSDDLSL